MMVTAFDGSKSVAVGEVNLVLEIGVCHFDVSFIIVVIPGHLTCYWDASRSILSEQSRLASYQKVKFIKGDRFITIVTEQRF